jgi:hypothetical protein
MDKYPWLNTKNGETLSLFADALKEKLNTAGESSAMLGGAIAASMRRKAIELDISPDEAVDFYFYTMTNKKVTKK